MNRMEQPTEAGRAGLARLEARVRKDLDELCRPPANWVVPRQVNGETVLDVMIIGGGMWRHARLVRLYKAPACGTSASLTGIPEGVEGPWVTYARMETPVFAEAPDRPGLRHGIAHLPCLVRSAVR